MAPTDTPHNTKRVMNDVARPAKTASQPTATAPATASRRRPRIRQMVPKRRALLMATIVAVLLFAAGGVYVMYDRLNEAEKKVATLSNPAEQARLELQELVGQVGALAQLPVGEEPIYATVSDVAKLKSQPFFANAENGDKALIYTKAKKAYLYRPSINKIIEIGPINLGTETLTTQ